MKLSYKYGFIGVGLGGTSIAAACAEGTNGKDFPYTSLLINTNAVDLEKVKTTNPKSIKKLIGNGKGAGRDIQIGENIFKTHEEELFEIMQNHFKDREFIWIAAGLGGGSGTGAVIRAIGLCLKLQKNFGLILTLPRESERGQVNSNALQRLNKIYSAMDKLGPIVLVDNEKLFNEFMAENPTASVEEYLAFSNDYVANAIHDKNIITANFGVYGSTNFDSSELGKMLMTPGAMHYARLEMKLSELNELNTVATMHNQKADFIQLLEKEIQKGVLATGFDFATTKRAAISVLAHENDASTLFNGTMSRQLEQLLMDLSPNASESPVSFHTYTEQQSIQLNDKEHTVYFYVIMSGLDLPAERIKKMIEMDKSQQAVFSKNNLFDEYVAPEQNSPLLGNTLESIFETPQPTKQKDVFDLLDL